MTFRAPSGRGLAGLLALFVLVSVGGAARAVPAGPGPAALRQPVAPLAGVDRHAFVAVTADELAVEDARRDAEGLPYRFALPVDLALTPTNAGTWEDLPDGRRLWRLRLASPGALSLSLGLDPCVLPPSALLHLYPAGAPERAVRLDVFAGAAHGQVWSPVLVADAVVLELDVAAADAARVALEVVRLGRGYRFFGEDPAAKAGPCNIDILCPAGDPWRDEADGVAMIALGATHLCTGFLINNTAYDARPLFMSGFHCDITAAAAPSLVAYWNYWSPVCGAQSGGSLAEFTSGATLVAGSSASDFVLVELDAVPDAAFTVKFLGWDRSGAVPDSAVTIHHPSTDEMSISFERDPLRPTAYGGTTVDPGANHLQITDWDLGTTERGSSGSPLFDPNHRVIGQLHGGQAACGNDLPDWYGRFATSWEGGGTPATRLRDHLDPDGTGALTTELLDPLQSRIVVSPDAETLFSRIDGGAIVPVSGGWTVIATGDQAVDWTAVVDVPWLALDSAGGTLAPGNSVTVTATPTGAALDLGQGRHTATVTFTNTSTGAGSTTRTVSLRVSPNALTVRGAVPNPAWRIPIEIHYDLLAPATIRATVTDMRGRQVRDLGAVSAAAGPNVLEWNGRDDDGRRVASGLYVVAVEGLGHVYRTRLTYVH
ncbi:hypothetical protein KDM41_10770 [bacterium]|nr:hypothetical protein [bacterium]